MAHFLALIFSAGILIVPLILFMRIHKATLSLKYKTRWVLLWMFTVTFFFAYVLLAISFVTSLSAYRDFLLVAIMFAGTIFVAIAALVFNSLVIGLNKKIAERTKEKNKKSLALNDLRDHFIFVAAHELRSPVTAIKWNLEVFRDVTKKIKFNQEQSDILNVIGDSNEYLIELVNDLLDVSRIESGTFNVKLQATNIEVIIDEVIQLLTFHAKGRGVKLDYKKIKEGAPNVMVDPRRFKEVLVNLVSNAIKYSPKGGVARVILKENKDLLELHVSDSGIGLSRKDISMLFKKFSRVKRDKTVKTIGTGLGLYISKKIIEKMKGKIWVKSEGRDKGSTFIFSMPITDKIPTGR